MHEFENPRVRKTVGKKYIEYQSRLLRVARGKRTPQWVKIAQKVSFYNIASEASYVYLIIHLNFRAKNQRI